MNTNSTQPYADFKIEYETVKFKLILLIFKIYLLKLNF